jgi:hypothetical protein
MSCLLREAVSRVRVLPGVPLAPSRFVPSLFRTIRSCQPRLSRSFHAEPCAGVAELGRSTDESSLTRGSARGFAVVTRFTHGRDLQGVPAGLLPGRSLPPWSMWPRGRLPFRRAPFRELDRPCRYARQIRSDWRTGNTERRRRTIRSYERRFPRGFQD